MVKIPLNKITRVITVALTRLFTAQGVGACSCSIAANVPPNAIAIIVYADRTSGAGTLSLYPDSGADALTVADLEKLLLPITGQEIKYTCSASSEPWLLQMVAYIVEGTLER